MRKREKGTLLYIYKRQKLRKLEMTYNFHEKNCHIIPSLYYKRNEKRRKGQGESEKARKRGSEGARAKKEK